MKNKVKLLLTLILIIIILTIFIIFTKKQNVNKIYPSVVHIECKNDNTMTVGSGIIYEIKNNKIYIVTNYHIIKGYSKINVYDEYFNKEFANLVGYDEDSDIAVITIKNNLNVKKATFDLNNKVSKKDNIYILTSFRGKDKSYIVKNASVKQVSKKIFLNDRQFDTIKLNYNIENGDSGSPVINKRGKVIGMIFLKDKEEKECGYALPIEYVLENIKMISNNDYNNLNLGALMTNATNIELLKEYNIDLFNEKGVVILSLKDNYPLSNSGLKKGDLIQEFNNKKIEDVKDLQNSINKCSKNEKVSIKYKRNGKQIKTQLVLSK